MSRPVLHLFAPFGIRAYHFTLGTPLAGLRREAGQSNSFVPGGRFDLLRFFDWLFNTFVLNSDSKT